MKYTIKTDLHTHTTASSHAYSSLEENVRRAKQIGLEAIAMTNHTPALYDAPHMWHFEAIDAVPQYIDGVRVLRGCEANILNINGDIDMTEQSARKLEIVIASIHSPCYADNKAEGLHTTAYMNVLENPIVDIIGHSGNVKCPYDIKKVVRRAKELGKLIEINSHTFDARKPNIENCIKIALACKEIGTGICVNSDAHFSGSIGDFDKALGMLSDIDFPLELIMNRDYETLKKFFAKRKEI